jgi:hypothetical protein
MSLSNRSFDTIAPGSFVLLNNQNTSLDKYLNNKEYLVKRIAQIRKDKTNDVNAKIDVRQKQIDNINSIMATTKLTESQVNQYKQLITELSTQIDKLNNVNLNPNMIDLNKTHYVFLNETYKPIISVGYSYSRVNTTPLPILGSTNNRIKIPVEGEFFCDMVLYIRLSSMTCNNAGNKVKYYDFPAHRLFKAIRFISDNTIIDEYNTEDMNNHMNFHINNSQKLGWYRCIGQETPKRCFLTQDPINQEAREEKVIYDGYQTAKYKQDSMEIHLPLQFWFCDPKFAMSNNNITYGKAFIEFDLCDESDLIHFLDYEGSGDGYTSPIVEECNLYTNHIYLIPEVSDLFSYHNTFSLIRLHRSMDRIVDKAFDDIHLNDLKFAVEQMYIFFRPIANDADDNAAEIWHMNSFVGYTELACPSIIKTAGVKSLGYTNSYYYTETPCVDYLSITASGSGIYDSNSVRFYDSYLPYRFGDNSISTPSREGNYLITFNLYPEQRQPSGYLNLSNSRENYLSYGSSMIDSSNVCRLHISDKCINFLYLSNGSSTIRFSS